MKVWAKCNVCGDQGVTSFTGGTLEVSGTCPACGASDMNVDVGTTPPDWAGQRPDVPTLPAPAEGEKP